MGTCPFFMEKTDEKSPFPGFFGGFLKKLTNLVHYSTYLNTLLCKLL